MITAPISNPKRDHPALHAIGFDQAFATAHGIGYAPKGILRGTVAIPIRDTEGNLLGYIVVTDAKLPADFTTNVVKFPRSA